MRVYLSATVAVLLLACTRDAVRPQLTVVLRGEQARVAAALDAVELPAQVRVAEVRSERVADPPPVDLSAARAAYFDGDLEECVLELADESAVEDRLAAGDRDSAARILFWRTACQLAAGDGSAADRTATDFSTLGLPIPPDADAASANVEGTLARALRAASEAPRFRVRIESSPDGASVRWDGEDDVCRTPCTVDAISGRHVYTLRRDGFVDVSDHLTVDGGEASAHAELTAADPDLAARQWHSRALSRGSVDDPVSMAVLANAARAERLVLIESTKVGNSTITRGTLAVEGELRARGERRVGSEDELGEELGALLTDVLERGELLRRVRAWEEPLFWVVIIGVVAAAATITGVLLYEPEQTYTVGFPQE